jgi:hypothetical protein
MITPQTISRLVWDKFLKMQAFDEAKDQHILLCNGHAAGFGRKSDTPETLSSTWPMAPVVRRDYTQAQRIEASTEDH